MKEKYGAKSPRSCVMRFHSQTAGVTLTAQQPMNNVVRVAYQALAAVLGGTQSLHTNSMDETLALPTEEAVQVALRTQQVLAYETGVPNVIDPLGGSYYVEALTDQLEREAEALFDEIDAIGGVVAGLESGWFQRKIAQSAARQQWEIEQHRRTIVGVNEFVTDEPELSIPTLKVGADAERAQRERMATMRAERDQSACTKALDRLREAARGTENVFPHILECARRYCTLYEIRAAMEDVFGAYREPVFF
jgi:methylmalonyl-CoA mutase N-terminal domain/subunit